MTPGAFAGLLVHARAFLSLGCKWTQTECGGAYKAQMKRTGLQLIDAGPGFCCVGRAWSLRLLEL